jgi:hypothetical protein
VNEAAVAEALDREGFAVLPDLLGARDCIDLVRSYDDRALFRSRIVMARYGFGRGEYSYFAYPLPEIVAGLRESFYPPLAEVANRWNAALGIATRFPADHVAYVKRCHRAGQTKSTPLLLQYGEGDYNCLHQDLYGDEVFPCR